MKYYRTAERLQEKVKELKAKLKLAAQERGVKKAKRKRYVTVSGGLRIGTPGTGGGSGLEKCRF